MEKLDRLGWVVHRSFRVGEIDLGIRTTSPAFQEWLDYTLDEYRTEEETPTNYSVVIGGSEASGLSRRRAHVLYRITATMLRTFHLPTVGRALLDDLGTLIYATEDDDSLYAEVGAIEVNGKTALVPLILWSLFNPMTSRAERMGIRLSTARIHRLDLYAPFLLPLPTEKLRMPHDALPRLEALHNPVENGHVDRMIVQEERPVDAVFAWGHVGEPYLKVSRGDIALDLAVAALNLRVMKQSALEGLARFLEGMPTFVLNADRPGKILETVVEAMEKLPDR